MLLLCGVTPCTVVRKCLPIASPRRVEASYEGVDAAALFLLVEVEATATVEPRATDGPDGENDAK